MKYIITSRIPMSEYIMGNLQGDHRVIYSKNKSQSFITKVLRHLFYKIHCYKILARYTFQDSFLRDLHSLGDGDSVILFGIDNPKSVMAINAFLKENIRKYIYIQNPVASWLNSKYRKVTISNEKRNPIIQKRLSHFDSLGFSIVTFDEQDALLYGLNCVGQVLVYPNQNVSDSKEAYDFYFCGRRKNRGLELDSVVSRISDFNNKIIIVGNSEGIVDRITYFDNIENVQKSKCLIEITQKSQVGITARVLEALFFKKKLLTNNVGIKNYDFYNEANVYILNDESETRSLKDFLEVPYKEIEKSITDKYDINNWIESVTKL